MKTPPPSPRVTRGIDPTIGRLSLVALSLAVFLLFRPYQGIMHDARLYVGYAMAALDPDGIGRDIVFVNDGQSKFSVYPVLMRELARQIGPSYAAIVLTYSGLMLWFAAFVALVRRLVGDRMHDVQIAAVIVLAASLPAFYGGQGVFRAAEFYATPRVFAEACVLAAFAAILARRTTVVIAAFVIGLAFHPLMTAPGIGVALWFHAELPRARRLLIAAATCGFAALVVGTLLVDGVGKPFARFDAEWMQALNTNHALVFMRNWRAGDAMRIVVQMVTVLLATPLLAVKAQRLVWSALVVVGAGVSLSGIGADLLSNVLVTQVQAWRGLWVLATVATVMLGVLLSSTWSAREGTGVTTSASDLRKASTVLLVLAWFVVELNSMGLLFAMLAVLFWQLPARLPRFALPPRGVRAIVSMAVVILILNVVAHSWVNVTTAWSSPDTTLRWSWFTMVSTGVPGFVTLVVAGVALVGRRPLRNARAARILPWISFALLAFTLSSIDSRTQYQRYIERELDARATGVPTAAIFTRGQTILWPYADLEPWALAGSEGWGTIVQSMPNVFDRALAIEWARRNTVIRAAGLLPIAQSGAATIATLGAVVDSNAVRVACGSADSPDLLAIPDVQLHHVYPTHVIQLPVPRILYPYPLGKPWGRIDRYLFVTCEKVHRNR